MTAQHLLRDQRAFFNSFPLETITIGTQTVSCLVPDDRESTDWMAGGVEQQPRATVIVSREALAVPARGVIASYRGIQWRVAEVIRNHAQAPLRINLENVT